MRSNLLSMTLVGFAAVLPAGVFVSFAAALETIRAEEMSVGKREDLRDEVLRAFRHAYGSYMTHACELVSCCRRQVFFAFVC